jgi:hypothetical protein
MLKERVGEIIAAIESLWGRKIHSLPYSKSYSLMDHNLSVESAGQGR